MCLYVYDKGCVTINSQLESTAKAREQLERDARSLDKTAIEKTLADLQLLDFQRIQDGIREYKKNSNGKAAFGFEKQCRIIPQRLAVTPLALPQGVHISHSHPVLYQWFESLFGFDDENMEYQQVKKNFKLSDDKRSLKSRVNGAEYAIGIFNRPSLGRLRSDDKLLRGKKNEGTSGLVLSMVLGNSYDLQAAPENRLATFQVASQFNCLEFPEPWYTPDSGIGKYYMDPSQGPASSVSAAAATVFRNYFAKVPTANGEYQYGQTAEHQIDNLARITNNLSGRYITVKNGYARATCENLKLMNAEKKNLQLGSYLRVGVHSDVGVTVGVVLTPDYTKMTVKPPRDQIITQVFCSAVGIVPKIGCTDLALWEPFARMVLDATYEATFLAALSNAANHKNHGASNVLYLTLVGGGVFGNELTWIFDSIRKAADKYKERNLKVIIVAFDEARTDETEIKVKEFVDDYNMKK